MPKVLIREVANYCWSNNFLKIFRNFFADHAEAFEDAPEMCSGEHNLKYYELFQIYLQLYEDTLTTYLDKLDVNITEFYQEVRECQKHEQDPYILVFIDCLLASTDYDSFYKVMCKQGLLSKSKKSSSSRGVDAKADTKGTTHDNPLVAADSKHVGEHASHKAEGKADYK